MTLIPSQNKYTNLIIDADSLIYRVGFASEADPPSFACQSLKSRLKAIKDACDNPSQWVTVIGGKGNFREQLSTTVTYKGNRPTTKPKHFEVLREYIMDNTPCIVAEGMEADDVCSHLLYQDYKKDKHSTVVASMDKDLWNTPGWHFNYDPRKWVHEYVPMKVANINFARQLLTGDRIDNIPGLPYCTEETIACYHLNQAAAKGCGQVSARKIIPSGISLKDAMHRVAECYIFYGLRNSWPYAELEEYFLEQGRLLWMTREMENFKPVLWEIPSWLNLKDLWTKYFRRETSNSIGNSNSHNNEVSAHYV